GDPFDRAEVVDGASYGKRGRGAKQQEGSDEIRPEQPWARAEREPGGKHDADPHQDSRLQPRRTTDPEQRESRDEKGERSGEAEPARAERLVGHQPDRNDEADRRPCGGGPELGARPGRKIRRDGAPRGAVPTPAAVGR